MISSQLLRSLLLIPVLTICGVAPPLAAQTPAGEAAPVQPAPVQTGEQAAPGDAPPLGPLPSGFPTSEPAPESPPATAPAAAPVPVAPAQAPAPEADAAGAPVAVAVPVAVPAAGVPPSNPRGASYRPGQGFVLTTDEGDFELRLGLLGQLRYRYRDGPGRGDQLRESRLREHVADVRHARLRVGGYLLGEHNRYFMQLAFAPDEVGRAGFAAGDGVADLVTDSPLYDFFLRFDHLRDAALQVGQFRVPFSRARLIAPERLLLADRGLVNRVFNLDRDIGVTLGSEDLLGLSMLRYQLGLFIGEGRNASLSTSGAGDRGFLITARAELLPLGLFDTSDMVDFDRSATPQLALGVGYAAFQGDAVSPASARYLGVPRLPGSEQPLVDFSAHNLVADGLLKWMGFSALASFNFRSVDGYPDGADGLGFSIEGGYLLSAVPVSFGARGGFVRITKDESVLPEQDELSLSVGYHMLENMLKVQLVFNHLWTRTISESLVARDVQPAVGQQSELAIVLTAAP